MKLKAPDDDAATAFSPINCFSGICLAAFLTIVYPSTGVAKSGAGELNATEQWVVTQTSAGEIADLSKQFKEEDKRKLSAHFLEELLTGALPGIKLHRHGARIIGAIIDEPVDLENAQIPCEVWLEHCQFNASANFNGANFAGTISFENSAFKTDAGFNSIKAGRAVFNDAVFEGPVDFVSADVVSNFEANGTKFQNKEKIANFSGMKVRGYAFFNGAVFEGAADFASADIGSNFEAHGARFQNKEKIANFASMKVGGDVSFNDAVFEGPVSFILADIAGNFSGRGAMFQNKETGANFSSLKVRGYAFFLSDAVFEGPANFGSANIASVFAAPGAKFQNKEKQANFGGMKVGGYAFFNDAVFEGPVNFALAEIATALSADQAKFQNKETEANFSSMKVGGRALFNDAVFEGPVNFVLAEIAGAFNVNDAKFHNKEREVNFNSMKIRGDAFFKNTVFEGAVNLVSADVAGNLEAQGAKFQNKEKDASFGGMKVGGYAFFNDAVFEGPVNFFGADIAGNFAAGKARFKNKEKDVSFSGMKLGGHAFFNDAVFEGPVNFNYADFAWLDLSKTVWPKVAGKFHMQGMNYKYIRAAPNEPESHRALLELADQSAYSADVYNHLEEFFLGQGYRDDADRAFIKGKRRERKENLHGLSRVGSCLLDWLVGYGRRPWQAGIPCAALVALGCVLFSPKKMEPQKPEDTPRVYSRFWYSLGLFLPFVDLQADKVWKPKPDQTFLRNYMRVHIMLGWILVPLVLAAVTGLIK
jgi:Icc-related predicted phosphoesterase